MSWLAALLRRPTVSSEEARPYLGLLNYLGSPNDHLDWVVEDTFGQAFVYEADRLGLVRMDLVGTDAEFWVLTERGRRMLAAQSPAAARKL